MAFSKIVFEYGILSTEANSIKDKFISSARKNLFLLQTESVNFFVKPSIVTEAKYFLVIMDWIFPVI